MANYCCAVRTNYFRVKDESAFREFMSRVASEDEIHIFEKQEDNNTLYGFGCYGSIWGVYPHGTTEEEREDMDPDDDLFCSGLREIVAPGDAVIIMEAGNEKLRYVIGGVTVITEDVISGTDMESEGVAIAKELLDNPGWSTSTTY